jgi:hypothetical protein
MTLLTIDTGLNQTPMIKDIFKFTTILIILHSLYNLSDMSDIGLLSKTLFNENFIVFLLLSAISFMAYYLVVLEIFEIK